MKSAIIRYILRRLSEASTLRGIVLTASSAVGMKLTEGQTDSAVWVVLGIVGLLGSLLPDSLGKNKTNDAQETTETELTIQKPDYKETKYPETGWGDK